MALTMLTKTLQGNIIGLNQVVCGGLSSAADPLVSSVSNEKFLAVWTRADAADGSDQRGIYWKHSLNGATASGECARFITQLDKAAAVAARGGHVSLTFGASTGSVAGEASAWKATLHVTNKAFPANGTYAALVGEFSVDGNDSSLAAATSSGLLRLTVTGAGDATAKAKVKNAIVIDGVSTGTGNMFKGSTSDAASDAQLQISVNGSPYIVLLKAGTCS